MTSTAETARAATAVPRRGPGRPATGARQRVLDAGLETLLSEGYAGLSYAKVAALAGENKSLISYYFGSRQGLVAAVAERIGERITGEVLGGIHGATSAGELVEGLVAEIWQVMDEDPRLVRLYFDLSAVSVVEAEVRTALLEVKSGWRQVLGRDLARLGVPAGEVEAAATYLLAGIEGLAIEKLEPSGSGRLDAARELFVRASGEMLDGLAG